MGWEVEKNERTVKSRGRGNCDWGILYEKSLFPTNEKKKKRKSLL